MADRLKVLMSAYACEPGKGSEQETGWRWGLEMARYHEVTVLTRANSRGLIERALAALPADQPVPRFIYHDERPLFQRLKKLPTGIWWYYCRWQSSARRLVADLVARERFALLHHVTFASFRLPAAVWGHGIPCIWGPIGGVEDYPWRMLVATRHRREIGPEGMRNLCNWAQTLPHSRLAERARHSTMVLATTTEMQAVLARVGCRAPLLPGMAIDAPPALGEQPADSSHPLRLLFVGRIVFFKGIGLLLNALKLSGTRATLTVVGAGNFERGARRVTATLGLREVVTFTGSLPRERTLRLYAQHDLFCFPSLHDSGGYVVLEAMAQGLPVVCLDHGGPAEMVAADCGVKVPLSTRAETIAGLAQAIRRYDADRGLLRQQGRAAYERVCQSHTWQVRAQQADQIYRQVAAAPTGQIRRR